jgi:hypothetical protein
MLIGRAGHGEDLTGDVFVLDVGGFLSGEILFQVQVRVLRLDSTWPSLHQSWLSALIGEPTGGINIEAGDINRDPLEVDANLNVHQGHHIRQCHALTKV